MSQQVTTETLFVLLADIAETKTGKKYLRLTVVNENKLRRTVTLFDREDPSEFQSKVCSLTLMPQEKFQPKVTKYKVLEDADPSPFYEVSAVNAEEAINYLKEQTRGNETLAKVVDKVLFESPGVLERFIQWPAARKLHHSFKGGLLEHTFCMAKLAEAAIKYDHATRGVDKDVVMAAIVLHDVAKVIAFDWEFPELASSSEKGRLLDHIVLGDEMVVRACYNLGIPTTKGEILHLRHCMLAHHGKKEWGSPVPPCTHEAVLVHHVDLMQSQVEGPAEIIRGLEVGAYQYDKKTESELFRWR
jgi:3'-5' exoribonuclease